LNTRTARVSGEGTVTLPFVGVVQANGLTEEQLRTAILHRLERYMYTPQVNLFVREYRSRQVAVVGAVEKPGLYNLASGDDTILDMLSLAGGLKDEAAPRLNFIPAKSNAQRKARESGATLPAEFVRTAQSSFSLKDQDEDPICINLNEVMQGGKQIYLSLPV